jgi:outer membrane protein assembly factor BamB
LAQTDKIANTVKKAGLQGFASWRSKDGVVWVLASISGSLEQNTKFISTNGNTPHGSIVAFRVEEANGKPVLMPDWVSRDLMNPAPPIIANGTVFAFARGDSSNHAILYALDATSGKELYSSGNAINTYAQLSGVSAGDGHVFLITHDNTLYSFGIPIEH